MNYNISVWDSHKLVEYPTIILVDHLFVDKAIKYLAEIDCLTYRDYWISYQIKDSMKIYDRPIPKLFGFKGDKFAMLLKLWLPVAPENSFIDLQADLDYFAMKMSGLKVPSI